MLQEVVLDIVNKLSSTISNLPNNEIFVGLVFTGLVSVTLYLLRNTPKATFHALKKNLSTQITFTNRSTYYVLNYVQTLPTIFGPKSYDACLDSERVYHMLGEGFHIKRYRNTMLIATVEVKYAELSGEHYIKLYIAIFGRQNKILSQFLNDVYSYNYGGDLKVLIPDNFRWRVQKTFISRSKESLFYPSNIMQDVLHDLNVWINSREKYKSLGIPYRRGYLFYGEHGTGKSSLIPILAEELGSKSV